MRFIRDLSWETQKMLERIYQYKYLCKINYILSPKIVKNFFEVIS
jgi:hypothetical protein